MSTDKKSPTDFLKSVYGRPVVVKLYTGVVFKGILGCLDGFMNVVLEQAEEIVDGKPKGRYTDCFLRGNNIVSISPNDEIQ